MFRRGNPPCFFAFDLLTCDGKDLRTERLLDRKQELRRLLAKNPAACPLKYTDHVDGFGTALFQRVCELDLEGIVAKQKFGPYVTEREQSTWYKILNRGYSQKDGREELFERERQSARRRLALLRCGLCWPRRVIAFPQVWLDLPLSPESQSLALGAALGVLTMKRALVVVGLAVLLLALLVYWHVISASTFRLILILAAAVAVYLVLIRPNLKPRSRLGACTPVMRSASKVPVKHHQWAWLLIVLLVFVAESCSVLSHLENLCNCLPHARDLMSNGVTKSVNTSFNSGDTKSGQP